MTVRNEHDRTYVSQFPFSVGQPISKNIGIYIAMVAALIVMVFGLWPYGRKPKPAAITK